jgi:hypothetical protein
MSQSGRWAKCRTHAKRPSAGSLTNLQDQQHHDCVCLSQAFQCRFCTSLQTSMILPIAAWSGMNPEQVGILMLGSSPPNGPAMPSTGSRIANAVAPRRSLRLPRSRICRGEPQCYRPSASRSRARRKCRLWFQIVSLAPSAPQEQPKAQSCTDVQDSGRTEGSEAARAAQPVLAGLSCHDLTEQPERIRPI